MGSQLELEIVSISLDVNNHVFHHFIKVTQEIRLKMVRIILLKYLSSFQSSYGVLLDFFLFHFIICMAHMSNVMFVIQISQTKNNLSKW